MRAFLAMTILSCSFVLAARAQTQENPAAQTSVVNNPSGQEAALKAELELVREYDERMQNTVYWSLGVVVLVTVLLAGFSWYTNFKVYDRDLNNLRTELKIFVEQEMSSSRSKLNELLSDKIKELSSSQEKLVSDIREEMGNLREHAGKIAINLDEEIKRDLKWLRVDVLRLEIKVREAHREPKSTILRDYISLFELTLAMNVVHLVGLSMRSIEDLLRDGATLGSDSVGRLSHALDGLPKEFGPKGELIRALIPAAMKDL